MQYTPEQFEQAVTLSQVKGCIVYAEGLFTDQADAQLIEQAGLECMRLIDYQARVLLMAPCSWTTARQALELVIETTK